MYARTSTMTAAPSSIDDGITYVRDEVLPAIQGMEGCLGLSLVVDRETGRCISTTSWETEETLAASRTMVLPLRDRAVELLGATAPTVEEWEIASMHRRHDAGPGTCVRASWSRVPSGQVDRALDFYKHSLLPHIEKLEGFVSASLLLDRATGRGVTSVAFESLEAMARTRDQADYLRATSTQEANVESLDVFEFELAVAQLHVPELV